LKYVRFQNKETVNTATESSITAVRQNRVMPLGVRLNVTNCCLVTKILIFYAPCMTSHSN